MKVNVSVEATAQEMREFLGLPNVQPLHDDLLQVVRCQGQCCIWSRQCRAQGG